MVLQELFEIHGKRNAVDPENDGEDDLELRDQIPLFVPRAYPNSIPIIPGYPDAPDH